MSGRAGRRGLDTFGTVIHLPLRAPLDLGEVRGLFLGHMAKALGDLKLAKKCYTRVLELDEKHIEAQRELRLMGTKG